MTPMLLGRCHFSTHWSQRPTQCPRRRRPHPRRPSKRSNRLHSTRRASTAAARASRNAACKLSRRLRRCCALYTHSTQHPPARRANGRTRRLRAGEPSARHSARAERCVGSAPGAALGALRAPPPAARGSAPRVMSQPRCDVCDAPSAPYTCPRCLCRYCTAACYRAHSAECVEAFAREHVCAEATADARAGGAAAAATAAALRRVRLGDSDDEDDYDSGDGDEDGASYRAAPHDASPHRTPPLHCAPRCPAEGVSALRDGACMLARSHVDTLAAR